MAENRRDRDKRFYFSRGQLVLLGGAFTITALIIFFLGIFVGRGIEERRTTRPEAPLIKIPVNPSTQGGAGSAGQLQGELTFYDTLAKSSKNESSLEEKAGEAKSTEKVARAKRKEVKTKIRETAPPVPPKADEKRPRQNSSPVQSSNTIEESGKAWYVQVNAFPDQESGKVSVDRLKNKGYNAHLMEARNNGKLWYRVRVGEFSSREEAEKIADILKSKENFPKAFAIRQ
ncbi:MAG TPA: SPOR domain-containing protein [Candidatus Binatia bacterium]